MADLEDRLRRLTELQQQIEADFAKPVTLLFTDIVGSTEFFESAGDIAGRQMIQTHNDLLFPIIEDHGGQIIKTIGDAIMASFPDPLAAVQSAVQMQHSLAQHNSGRSEREGIRVRMGLHYGKAVMDQKDLFGDMVNTAARVESKANGEEILISGELQERLRQSDLPLVFLGSETVKGKKRKIDFYAVNWASRQEQELLASWQQRNVSSAGGDRPPAGDTAAGRRRFDAPAVHSPRVRIHGNIDLQAAADSIGQTRSKGNPYLNRVMIPHPDMFFGRKALIKRISNRLCAQRPQSVSIVGERRIGKSSLLNHLLCARTRLQQMEEAERYICLFLDFQQLRSIDESGFLQLIYAELGKTLGDRIQLELSPDNDGMRFLCDRISACGYKLVLYCDEFESVTKNERIGARFYSFLRSLANNYPLAFVTASGRNLKDMCVTHEIADSPFFNIFAVQHLGLLRRGDADQLISGPSAAAGVPLEAVGSQILALGGLYPFFLQMACSAWFEHLEAEELSAEEFRDKSTPREVLQLFREESGPHYEYVLETLPETEVQALTQVLREQKPDPHAAESLERKGYIVSSGEDVYRPFSEEFRRFAARTWALD